VGGMSLMTFALLNAIGTTARLILIWYLGDAFSGPIDDFLNWVRDYQIPLTIVSIVTVVVYVIRARRRGEIETAGEIEDEIIEEMERLESEPGEGEPTP
jgi:membrane protein DedA with SNARE-associated domain